MSVCLSVTFEMGGGGEGLPRETGRVDRKEGRNGEGGISMMEYQGGHTFASNARSPS